MENKEIKQCPYCGEEILAVAKKCKHCGEWLINEEPVPIKMVSCPTCGEDVEEGKDVCPHCGETMSPANVDRSSIESQPTNARIQQPTVQPLPIEKQPSRDTKKEDCSSTTFFKDFFTGMGLTKGLLILFVVRFIILLLNLTESSIVEVIVSILDVIIGSIMSLLIIQRVANDRNKIDLTSFLAIGSCIFWPIGMYIGTEALNNVSLEALEYVRMDDSGEGAISLRYFFASGMVYFCLSLLLDVVSKFFMWQTAKPKFKSTLMLGMVAYSLMLLFVISSKSLSEGMLITGIMIPSLVMFVYYIMILLKGTNEHSIPCASAVKKEGSTTEEKKPLVNVTTSTLSQTSISNNRIIYIIPAVILVIVVCIVIFYNRPSEIENTDTEIVTRDTIDESSYVDNSLSESGEGDSGLNEDEDIQEGQDWLMEYATNMQSICPCNLGGEMTCMTCKYSKSNNTLFMTIRLDDDDEILYEEEAIMKSESQKMYLLTTISEVPKLTAALKVAQADIKIIYTNINGDDLGSTSFSYNDF